MEIEPVVAAEQKIRIGEITYDSKVGIIREVDITYDVDHDLYFLKVTIDYTFGGTQDAMIPLTLYRTYNNIVDLLNMYKETSLYNLDGYGIVALLKDRMIYGLLYNNKYMIFYGIETS